MGEESTFYLTPVVGIFSLRQLMNITYFYISGLPLSSSSHISTANLDLERAIKCQVGLFRHRLLFTIILARTVSVGAASRCFTKRICQQSQCAVS